MKKLLISIFIALLSACGSLRIPEPVDLTKQALIKAPKGSIIYEIDGEVVYSAFSQREQAVSPGMREIFLTRFGDVRFDQGLYRLNVSAGFIYEISENRQSVTISKKTGDVVDRLYLSRSDNKTFLNTAEHQLQQDKQQAAYKSEMNRQAMLAQLEHQRKLSELPMIRKIGAKICQRKAQSQLGPIAYIGYVERTADEKVQIRVSHAYYERHPNLSPGDFSPSIIWDNPMNWEICR